MASLIGMTAEQAAEAGERYSFKTVWATMDRLAEEADRRREEFYMLQAERQKEADKRQKEYAEWRAEQQREADRRRKESAEEFKELKRLHAETERAHKETERELKETERVLRETDRQMKETDRRLAEMSAKTDIKLARLAENVGGLSHSMGEIVETLVASQLWEKFELYHLDRGFQRVPVYDENKRAVAEIDILLSNTDFAVAVEVKTHLNKMEYVDRHIERMELVRRYPPAEVAINGKRVMGALAGGVAGPSVKEYAHRCGFFVLELSGESVRLAEPPAGFEPKVW